MVTPVTGRRVAHAIAVVALAGPAVLFGGTAWADPTPEPEAPVVQPSVGSWIIGGTLQEGTAAQPAQPAQKPAQKPATVTTSTTQRATTQRATTQRRTTGRTTSSTTQRTTTRTAASTSTGGAAGGATALPFTGNRVDALMPVGISLLVGGVVLTLAGRPRRAARLV